MAQSATAIRKDIQFNWVGTDKKGNKLKGRSLAASEQALRADLRRQGVVPVKVSKQSDLFKGGGKVKPEDIAIFSRQLATMLAAGIPLVASVAFEEDELPGAGYRTSGHLLVIVGFDENGDVVVNDPASHSIPSNDEVRTVYPREAFAKVWMRSRGLVYVIHPPSVPLPGEPVPQVAEDEAVAPVEPVLTTQ